MSKNTKIATIAIVAIVCVAGAYVLLGNNNNGDAKTEITISGSTTISPIMLAVQEIYEKENNVIMQISATGSGAGAAAALNGTSDIGMLSRDLKQSEIDGGLVQTVIGMDGIAVIINSSVTGVTGLTLKQIADIYSGKITNWSEVGGNNLDINVLSREAGSGTRDGFETALKGADSEWKILEDKIELGSTNAIKNTVDSTTGAIGYISIGYTSSIGKNTVLMEIDGVKATVENVLNGTYKIQRDLVLATKGAPVGETAKLIDWILDEKGQKILESKGYIPLAK